MWFLIRLQRLNKDLGEDNINIQTKRLRIVSVKHVLEILYPVYLLHKRAWNLLTIFYIPSTLYDFDIKDHF